jgi:cytochrome c oxidase cbb3-type subunit III
MTLTVLLLLSTTGMETALLLTGLLTALAVLIILLSLILPDEDRAILGAAYARMRRYLLTGTTGDVEEFAHQFDGIRELDNRIPPWFTTLFLATIVFAIVYLVDYHVVSSSPLMAAEYNAEVAAADVQRRVFLASEGTIDENALTRIKDPEVLTRAGGEFQKYCISCHGPAGGGIVGPNLTDQFWIHGGGIKNVYTTIKMGVPAKGMISWQLVFTPKQIQELASYVLSLEGTNPANAKKPEGTLYVPPPDTIKVASDTTKAPI